MHLVFDIDGTVIDHKHRMYGLYHQYCRARGISALGEADYFDQKRDGADERTIAEQTLPAGTVPEYLAWKRARIEAAEALDHDVLVNGIKGALEALASSHSLIALSARQSNELLVDQLASLGVGSFFRAVLSVGSASAADGKAAVLESHLSAHGIAPKDLILIGDTEVEIALARQAGTRCVSVDWGLRGRFYLLQHDAWTVVGSPRELCDVVVVQEAGDP